MSLLYKIKNQHRIKILLLADIMLISIVYPSTWVLVLGTFNFANYRMILLTSWVLFVLIFIIVFIFFKIYESLWRYAEAYEFIKCLLASITASFFFGLVTWIFLQPPLVNIRVPIRVHVLSAVLAGMSTLFLRMAYRAYRAVQSEIKISGATKKVLIIGAGETGNAIIQDIKREPKRRYEVVCIVDDDNSKIDRKMQQIKVEGKIEDIPKLVKRHGIELIIFAIPSATNIQRKRISSICAKTKCQLKKVPDLYSYVMDTQSLMSQITDVSVEDLLGRDVINIIPPKDAVYLKGKDVLVTGAGGSIGSELCRQIMLQKPRTMVMVDVVENGLYVIEQELYRIYGNKCPIQVEIASVRDESKLDKLFKRYMPQFVYHAAAHKHVPLMEMAPDEAVKNNIFGTLNIARCADQYKAERFVMVSTDKAVKPTSVMGATKRICEMIVQHMDKNSQTEFVSVRFGNVLGSNGSVIPKFKNQISKGGPVTVTHIDITRFFMTISEAVSLILTAGRIAKGGEIFVLDMGEPIKIVDLAEALIRLSGFEPYKEIDIIFTGLRPGEKLYEELLMEEEGLKKTSNKKIFIGKVIDISPERMFTSLDILKQLAEQGQPEIVVAKLREMVPGYVPYKNSRI